MRRSWRSRPRSFPAGRLKLTEQGETISFKYGVPELAERNLEAALAGTILAAFPERSSRAPDPGERALLDSLAARAEERYRALVADPAFVGFFRAITPVDELALLDLGSRPARRPDGGDYLGSLRAIPWVFAWTQNRALLPAWFGCGAALGDAIDAGDLGRLRSLYRGLPFFRSLVDNLEMTLAKSRLEIAREYLELVPPELEPARLFGVVAEDHARTLDAVLLTMETRTLLGAPARAAPLDRFSHLARTSTR